jgi:hypothetical protein
MRVAKPVATRPENARADVNLRLRGTKKAPGDAALAASRAARVSLLDAALREKMRGTRSSERK